MKTTLKYQIFLLLALLGLSGTSLAGYHDKYSVNKSAYKLDRAAGRLYDKVHYEFDYSPATYKAKEFARAANRFCSDVERGVSFRQLWRSFERLRSRHYALEDALHRTKSRHGYRHDDYGLNRVNKWFGRLEQAMERQYTYHHRRDRGRHHDGRYGYHQSRNRDALDYALRRVFDN